MGKLIVALMIVAHLLSADYCQAQYVDPDIQRGQEEPRTGGTVSEPVKDIKNSYTADTSDTFGGIAIVALQYQELKEGGLPQFAPILDVKIDIEPTKTLFAGVQIITDALFEYDQIFLGVGATLCLLGDKEGGIFVHGHVGGLLYSEIWGRIFPPSIATNIGASLHFRPFSSLPPFEIGVVRWRYARDVPLNL